jgi:hypothetical protein
MVHKRKDHPAPISQKKIEANRKNSQQSTGPISQMGKEIARWNSLKHGLLAKEIIINLDGSDASKQFEFLLTELRNDHRPEGVLEEMLIERIAVCYWRLRRVYRAEKGEIEQQAPLPEYTKAQNNSSVFTPQITAVRDAIRELKQTGTLAEATADSLRNILDKEEEMLFPPVQEYFAAVAKLPVKTKPKAVKEITLDLLIEKEKELIEEEKIYLQNKEFTSNAKMASLNLPSGEKADKILRYENSILRDLYRAMNQLERLQRQRRGEYVPPPVNVEGLEELK